MKTDKCIVIGCNNNTYLSAILDNLRDQHAFNHTIISATKFSDIVKIARTINPNLFIFCFHDNQPSLHNFNDMISKPETPVLCITGRHESETIKWNKNNIVFTCAYEAISIQGYLNTRVNSILKLQAMSSPGNKTKSFAEAAITDNQRKDSANMSRYVLELDQKINTLQHIKERITTLYPRVEHPVRTELLSIVNAIKQSINDRKLWNDFKLLFEKTDPHFLYTLAKKHPCLTPVDLKYCCYIKMNMSNDDIRNLLGISQESVRTHKYRLKKKLTLKKAEELETYLRDLSSIGAFN